MYALGMDEEEAEEHLTELMREAHTGRGGLSKK
jgi:hypothetical protein